MTESDRITQDELAIKWYGDSMISECIDHGCKGYGSGYATAWIKLPCGTSQLHRIITGESRVIC